MKVALIGYGVIGKVHYNVIKESIVNLVGLCDIDNEKLLAFPSDITYNDYKLMLDETNPDVVHICTPHYLHKEMIVEALKRNINVLCEKPICINEVELLEIEKVLNNSTAQLGICYQNRYEPVMQYVKSFLKDRKVISAIGKLLWHRDINYYNQAEWRGKKAFEGGGVLINQAIHTLDLLQYFATMPKEIIAYIDNVSLQNQIEVEDTAYLFSSDQAFNLFATNAAISDFPVQIILKTENEIIEIRNNEVYVNGEINNFTMLEEIPGAKKIYGGGHSALIKDFYDCIIENRKFAIDFYEASKSLKIVLAAYQSNGKVINL